MKKIALIFISCIVCTTAVLGQTVQENPGKEELKKLSFMVGEWEGEGWMMNRDGTRQPFLQTENVQFKLDSTAILIEGRGTTEDGKKVIHNALAVLRVNPQDNTYTFNSYLSTGQGGSFKAELIDESFYWYPNENMRYIIRLNENGQWYEIGEINRNGNWFQFFEMTLDKTG